MFLSNSVVADLLSFSLGMLPSEWRRLAKQKFDHALLWDPIAASETLSRSFTADTDSWYVALGAVATSRDVATQAAQADRPYSIEIKSTSGGRDFRVPDGVETVVVVAAEGQPAGLRCAGDPEVFLDGTQPWQRCNPWGWFIDRRLHRITDYAEASEAEPRPPVAAARRPGRRRQRTLWHLPEWLDLFRRR